MAVPIHLEEATDSAQQIDYPNSFLEELIPPLSVTVSLPIQRRRVLLDEQLTERVVDLGE
jgi:hypothetical protein